MAQYAVPHRADEHCPRLLRMRTWMSSLTILGVGAHDQTQGTSDLEPRSHRHNLVQTNSEDR